VGLLARTCGDAATPPLERRLCGLLEEEEADGGRRKGVDGFEFELLLLWLVLRGAEVRTAAFVLAVSGRRCRLEAEAEVDGVLAPAEPKDARLPAARAALLLLPLVPGRDGWGDAMTEPERG
jgi:hypothetical protein